MTGAGATLRWASHLRPSQVLWRLWRRARRPLFARRPMIAFATPAAPPGRPVPALWPGDRAAGQAILAGRIRLLGREAAFGAAPDWHPAAQSPLWRFTLNYCEWLADLAALDTPAAAARARALVRHWIESHTAFDDEAWHPYPLSLRLVAWLAYWPLLTAGAEADEAALFAAALDAHARHLPQVLEYDVGGNHLVKNLKALALAGACLPGHAHLLAPALARLEHEIGRQVLADGCHYERSPSYHLQVLRDLIDLRATLPEPPDWLCRAIAAMAPALALLQHGGGLALFNDGDTGEPAVVARALALAGWSGDPPAALPAAGYHRLAAGGVVVIVDAGRCGPDELPAHAHADTLSFECSDGQQRMVVNSGTYAYQDPVWRTRLRGTAAHSTLTVDDVDSAEVFGVFRLGRRPRQVTATRDGDWLVASHDGYRHLGVTHARRLRLAADGSMLMGQDSVSGQVAGRRIAARFHLHPDVAAEARPDGAIGLTLTDGTRWRFTATGGTATLADGIHAPHFHVLLPTRTIVLAATGQGRETILSWQFERTCVPRAPAVKLGPSGEDP